MNEKTEIKNICIYGVGGVGGYFGGMLCRGLLKAHPKPDTEYRVYFVARGRHYEEIRSTGLTLQLEGQGEVKIRPYAVVNDVALIPPADIYIICTKSYDLCAAVEAIKDRLTKDTVILPLLNGINIYEKIRAVSHEGIVLPACVYIASYVERPGTVRQQGPEGRIVFGRDPRNYSHTPKEILELLGSAGILHEWVDNPYPLIYEKYMLICSFALVTAGYGVTMGRVLEDDALKSILLNVMQEIKSIAEKKGIKMSEGIIEKCIDVVRKYPADTKTSFQRDVEQMKEHNEGELYADTIIRAGEELGIATPFTRMVSNLRTGKSQ